MPSLPELVKIDLGNNEIDRNGALALVLALPSNVKEINLSNNLLIASDEKMFVDYRPRSLDSELKILFN